MRTEEDILGCVHPDNADVLTNPEVSDKLQDDSDPDWSEHDFIAPTVIDNTDVPIVGIPDESASQALVPPATHLSVNAEAKGCSAKPLTKSFPGTCSSGPLSASFPRPGSWPASPFRPLSVIIRPVLLQDKAILLRFVRPCGQCRVRFCSLVAAPSLDFALAFHSSGSHWGSCGSCALMGGEEEEGFSLVAPVGSSASLSHVLVFLGVRARFPPVFPPDLLGVFGVFFPPPAVRRLRVSCSCFSSSGR